MFEVDRRRMFSWSQQFHLQNSHHYTILHCITHTNTHFQSLMFRRNQLSNSLENPEGSESLFRRPWAPFRCESKPHQIDPRCGHLNKQRHWDQISATNHSQSATSKSKKITKKNWCLSMQLHRLFRHKTHIARWLFRFQSRLAMCTS